MDKSLVASSSIDINTSADKIWEILTNPEKIKIFLFGTQTITDWKEGSPIIFQGEYNGQQYKDKGNVLENSVNKLLKYNYWSGFSGLDDKEENYSIVCYTIEKLDSNTSKFSWTQSGFSSKEGQCHTEEGLGTMLKEIKRLAEEKD